MTNILLEGYDIDANWLYDELSEYIKPPLRVVVVAFSFRDSRVSSRADWDLLYSEEKGKYYRGIVNSFASYGISEDHISWINYFADSKETAAQKIAEADIIYLPGGLPDRMMTRIREFDLYDRLRAYEGIVIGYSAGALIQLAEYHVSPDADYPAFQYHEGLGYLNDFDLEVHYVGSAVQKASIRRVLTERGKSVYATALGAGAIVVDKGNIKLLGDVKVFH
ncbi:MAG: Type 1 glutamine amidotransferase-like domain-containing protein [Acutalibacteraceae bacterium]